MTFVRVALHHLDLSIAVVLRVTLDRSLASSTRRDSQNEDGRKHASNSLGHDCFPLVYSVLEDLLTSTRLILESI